MKRPLLRIMRFVLSVFFFFGQCWHNNRLAVGMATGATGTTASTAAAAATAFASQCGFLTFNNRT